MKKVGLIILLSLIFISSLVSVSAYSASYYGNFVADTMSRVVGIIQDFLGPVFAALLGVDGFNEFFFSRIILSILLFAVIFVAVGAIPIFQGNNNKAIRVIITATVTLLGIRFMADNELIQGVLLPYGVLGVSISIFLPIFIFGFFVHKAFTDQNSLGRRIAWLVFAAVFFGLWFTRYSEIGQYNWIYMIGVGLVIALFIFDRQLHDYIGITAVRQADRTYYTNMVADLTTRRDKLNVAIAGASGPLKKQMEKTRDEIEKDIIKYSRKAI